MRDRCYCQICCVIWARVALPQMDSSASTPEHYPPIFVDLEVRTNRRQFLCLSPTRHTKARAVVGMIHLVWQSQVGEKTDATTLACRRQPVTWFAGPRLWQSDTVASCPIPLAMRSLLFTRFSVDVAVFVLKALLHHNHLSLHTVRAVNPTIKNPKQLIQPSIDTKIVMTVDKQVTNAE
ncbi:hypothetical protein B5807_02801 [Epicoccum nigrum]|uniref:Uncharacterized protein n=1 Tax=Epicoccum nigrum TaxID=105696 RepID=A0A1Y2MAK0_EPING|nr:hypothetical protein B5807_02801 [Epicoccum nigrum]